MSAAEKMEPEAASELRTFFRSIGNFEHADDKNASMAELSAALVIGYHHTLAEFIDSSLAKAVGELDDSWDDVFGCNQFASKDAWSKASDVKLRSVQQLQFIRELLRRCFAEGILEDTL